MRSAPTHAHDGRLPAREICAECARALADGACLPRARETRRHTYAVAHWGACRGCALRSAAAASSCSGTARSAADPTCRYLLGVKGTPSIGQSLSRPGLTLAWLRALACDTHTRTHTRTNSHAHTHAHTHTRARTRIHASMHAAGQDEIQRQSHKRTHPCTHAPMHAPTHARNQTQNSALSGIARKSSGSVRTACVRTDRSSHGHSVRHTV